MEKIIPLLPSEIQAFLKKPSVIKKTLEMLIVLMIYNLFNANITILFLSIFFTLKYYIKLRLDVLMAKLLPKILPNSVKNAFEKRSIFDIMCDIWFLPKFSIYIKAFLKPLFLHITPE